jgi:hypothetical protein
VSVEAIPLNFVALEAIQQLKAAANNNTKGLQQQQQESTPMCNDCEGEIKSRPLSLFCNNSIRL